MIFKAFKHYLQHNVKKSLKLVALLEFFASFMWLPAAFYIPKMFFYRSDVDHTHTLMLYFYIYLVSWPLLLVLKHVLCGLYYAVDFFRYDVIARHYGYRAFRHELSTQQYHEQYFSIFGKMEERIVASAIRDHNGTVFAVMCPGRHHHCRAYMAECGEIDHEGDEGFVTNKLRFVDREKALRLALAVNQVTKPFPWGSEELFSEDLWGTPAHLVDKG